MLNGDDGERVLILAPVGRDGPLLHAVLTQAGLPNTILADSANLASSLRQGVGAVLLTEEALVPAVMQTLQVASASQPEWSNLPIVMLVDRDEHMRIRRVAHEFFGPDQNLTILDRPVSTRTVGQIVQAVLAGRRRQYEVRDLFTELAVQNERLRQEVANREQGEERLRTLYHLSELESRATSLEQLYEATLCGLEHLLQVERSSILLVDADGVMRLRAWHNLSHTYRERVEGRSPWPANDQNAQPVLIPDVAQAELGPLRPFLQDEGIAALAFIPLIEGGRLLGMFALYYQQPYPFPETEVQLAQTMARHVAHGIQRKQAEALLLQMNATLERRVIERTAELERSNRELDQFAYVASHDLKAPLRAISLLALWIAEDTAELLPAASKAHLAKLHSRIKRMEALLEDLLAYSRAGRQRHLPELVDVAALIHKVIDLVAPPPNFEVTISATLPRLYLERVPLEMVLRNLIDNAIKHHPQPSRGLVDITAVEQGQWIQFTVADNGPGIDPVFHQRIFEIFQTLRPRDEVEGSGMGLTVVKKLIESRGGTIRLESRSGHGAIFYFNWPHSFAHSP